MRVLVLTVVHHPGDARILYRQIAAMVEAGHEIVYAAPWSATGTAPPPGLEVVDLPRAAGRRRFAALRRARSVLRSVGRKADLVLVHDPELLLAIPLLRRSRPPIVWDVHEDLGRQLTDKAWLPAACRRPVAGLVHLIERAAERRVHVVLAEGGYQARFRRRHPVVPNDSTVPLAVAAPGADRVVYLGRVSVGRGAAELCAIGAALATEGIRLDVYGWAEPDVTSLLESAHMAGAISWHGRVANDDALDAIAGALCGLSLLHDLPNYRHSRPTKVVEYMGRGLPVVTTPLPIARALIERHRCGTVVPFGDVDAAVAAIRRLRNDPTERAALGRRGHDAALAHHDWTTSGPAFVRTLERWASCSADAQDRPVPDPAAERSRSAPTTDRAPSVPSDRDPPEPQRR